MTLLLDSSLGLGQIQRAALAVLVRDLNDAIVEINAAYATEDASWETFMGRDPVATVTEQIALSNFHEGHRPSLINAPIDKYPNCCAWVVRAVPSGESDAMDHMEIFNDLLYIEVMAKASPGEDEEVVNRRISRTAEAVHISIGRNKTLGGLVSELGTPTVNLSDVFLRRERTSSGPQWCWQGARLEYAVRKDAVLPMSTPGSSFQTAEAPAWLGADIDQA